MNDTLNNTTTAPNLTEAFETETCGRCGGSGNYSYCPGYGTRCFKCGGKGKVYSKRGAAALAYGRELRTVPANEVQVGWLLWETSLARWAAGRAGSRSTPSAPTDRAR